MLEFEILQELEPNAEILKLSKNVNSQLKMAKLSIWMLLIYNLSSQ